MKFILISFLSFLSLNVFGQYSSYYHVYQTSDVNVNHNSQINVEKTVRTIDYSALAQANALAERNRLENSKYNDEKELRIALEIAQDPLNAFTYGRDNNWEVKASDKRYGVKRCTYYHKIPHKSLFTKTSGYTYRNESNDGVVTTIDFRELGYMPVVNPESSLMNYFGNVEGWFKEISNFYAGKTYKDHGFVHHVELNKATVFTHDGFVQTLIHEDDYEKTIRDHYAVITSNGFAYAVMVEFSGNKNLVSFEQLEGRRYYMGRLCRQIVATAQFKNIKMYK